MRIEKVQLGDNSASCSIKTNDGSVVRMYAFDDEVRLQFIKATDLPSSFGFRHILGMIEEMTDSDLNSLVPLYRHSPHELLSGDWTPYHEHEIACREDNDSYWMTLKFDYVNFEYIQTRRPR